MQKVRGFNPFAPAQGRAAFLKFGILTLLTVALMSSSSFLPENTESSKRQLTDDDNTTDLVHILLPSAFFLFML
jgi:hypothetical protein